MSTLRLISCLILTLLLTGCMMKQTINQLPPGSTVAVISGLDNHINYSYFGSTRYMDATYQYKASSFNPDEAFIPPIRTSLSRSGYHVIDLHVPANSPITNEEVLNGPLTGKQVRYLQHLLRGRHVDRVIIIAKSTEYDINHLDQNASGYGYIQSEGVIYRATQVYGAVTIRVINMNNWQAGSRQLTYIGNQANNDYFVSSRLHMHQRSVDYFERWFNNKFAPIVIDAMHQSGLLTH